MDHLGPLDSVFVEAEGQDAHTSMAIASIGVFEGPPPGYEEIVGLLQGRLPRLPHYRQRLVEVPAHAGSPVWVDDGHFDIRYHVRQTGLPAPGGDAELCRLMGRLMSQRLDRDRPLWETWVVTGLRNGRWALISKVHHCMVDGVSGTDLYRVLLATDGTPEIRPFRARRAPSTPALLSDAARVALGMPRRLGAAALASARHPRRAGLDVVALAGAVRDLAPQVAPAPRSSLSGPIGSARRYCVARVAVADVVAIKREAGGTLNDVVLAAVTAGFRDLLLARGEQPTRGMVPSLVPVSLRAPGEQGVYGNRVSGLVVDLPVHLATPQEQLKAVRAEMGRLKAGGEALAGAAVVSLARYLPYPLASLTRLLFRLPQRELVTVATNVPGPRQTLDCLGRRLIEIMPFVPIASTVRIGVAIMSYDDRLVFGVTGDYDSAPDIDVLARGIERAVQQLGATPARPEVSRLVPLT